MTPGATALRVRTAVAADNAALVALARASIMEGDIGLAVDRAPDFFVLNRLEGDPGELLVAVDGADRPVGCIAIAARERWVCGVPTRAIHVGDFKVARDWRGGPAADQLTLAARDSAIRLGGADAPVTITVLGGNVAMERRTGGPRGLPGFARFATLVSWSVPLLWPRRRATEGRAYRVTRAGDADLAEMAALWGRVAPGRQLAPRVDADGLAAWIAAAPGLATADFRLVRSAAGTLVGFAGLWDHEPMKRYVVTRWSRPLAAARAGFNALAPLFGAVRLPARGHALRTATLTHVCFPASGAGALRALVDDAYGELRGRQSFLGVGLDARDPLRAALDGLLAQPTTVQAYVTSGSGRWTGPALDDRPLHHEIALT